VKRGCRLCYAAIVAMALGICAAIACRVYLSPERVVARISKQLGHGMSAEEVRQVIGRDPDWRDEGDTSIVEVWAYGERYRLWVYYWSDKPDIWYVAMIDIQPPLDKQAESWLWRPNS